jgi:hypothetical protein
MTLRPKTPTDLTLAPVATEIDQNLQLIRDADLGTILESVAVGLNKDPSDTRDGRAEQVLALATRNVDLHGWTLDISDDATRVHMRGGSVTLDIGLSANIRRFIDDGTAV